ncbi:MAG: hypothetical protein HXS50_02215 [Theionarchaea archaeon]|nr:hypothetical protein [Theionarchaea archaeon]
MLFSSCVSLALDDGRIGVLYISDPVRVPGFNFMRAEPLYSLTFVAASLRGFGGWELADVRRAIRLYLPRNYENLVSNFDIVTLDNANRNSFTTKNIDMLARGIEDGGLAFLMTGGWESFGAHNPAEAPPWGQSSVGRLLPTEDVVGTWNENGRMVIDEVEHELMTSVPWESRARFMIEWHHNTVTTKQGANLLAHAEYVSYPGGHPLLVTWKLEGGNRVFACTGEIALMAMHFEPWDYYGDFISNLMIYMTGRPVPQDVELVHLVRSRVFESSMRRSLMLGLIEFIEKFGANTQELIVGLDEIELLIDDAREAYIDLRFIDVLETFNIVEDMFDDLERRSMQIKDQTLFWVSLIEWMAVSATTLIAGIFLWTIMVRRSLYRQTRSTRFR